MLILSVIGLSVSYWLKEGKRGRERPLLSGLGLIFRLALFRLVGPQDNVADCAGGGLKLAVFVETLAVTVGPENPDADPGRAFAFRNPISDVGRNLLAAVVFLALCHLSISF